MFAELAGNALCQADMLGGIHAYARRRAFCDDIETHTPQDEACPVGREQGPTMAGHHPDHQVRLPVARMVWKHTVFLHYRCDAEQIARLLPSGLTPHLFADQAWLSVTPLVMHRVRPAGLPAPP